MNRSKISRILLWLFTALALIGVSMATRHPHWVEAVYSTRIYPSIGLFQRRVSGFFPFSLGDIVYTLLSILLIIIAFRFFRQLIRRELRKAVLLTYLGRVVLAAAWVYILFYGVWGLNYYRQGISNQLNLQVDTCYDATELKKLRCALMDELKTTRQLISQDTLLPVPAGDLFAQAINAYAKAAERYPFLRYENPAMKRSMFGALGKYGGYTGYYNPFSGEGQIRGDMPKVIQPFTICHEMAHQLGYASESEANFVGYLVCMASDDRYFKYSALLDIFHYVTAELMTHDPEAYVLHPQLFFGELDTMVQRDRLAIRRFFLNEQNNVAPIVSSLYNQYLLANNQIRGVESYYDVVAWVLALRKRESSIVNRGSSVGKTEVVIDNSLLSIVRL